jgi:hypothetical protein
MMHYDGSSEVPVGEDQSHGYEHQKVDYFWSLCKVDTVEKAG